MGLSFNRDTITIETMSVFIAPADSGQLMLLQFDYRSEEGGMMNLRLPCASDVELHELDTSGMDQLFEVLKKPNSLAKETTSDMKPVDVRVLAGGARLSLGPSDAGPAKTKLIGFTSSRGRDERLVIPTLFPQLGILHIYAQGVEAFGEMIDPTVVSGFAGEYVSGVRPVILVKTVPRTGDMLWKLRPRGYSQ